MDITEIYMMLDETYYPMCGSHTLTGLSDCTAALLALGG